MIIFWTELGIDDDMSGWLDLHGNKSRLVIINLTAFTQNFYIPLISKAFKMPSVSSSE